MAKMFEVKVQLSLFGSTPQQRMLIYNQDRSITYECDAPYEMQKLMRHKKKAFFNAHMDGTVVVLDGRIPDREW